MCFKQLDNSWYAVSQVRFHMFHCLGLQCICIICQVQVLNNEGEEGHAGNEQEDEENQEKEGW